MVGKGGYGCRQFMNVSFLRPVYGFCCQMEKLPPLLSQDDIVFYAEYGSRMQTVALFKTPAKKDQ